MPHSDSLRTRLVEAGARAIFYSGERTKNLVWDSINDDQRRYYVQLSRDALDGHLDCLAESADEIAVDQYEVFVASDGFNGIRPRSTPDVVRDLLRVLREDR